MADLKGVEIFAVGKWNGISFTESDLVAIASAFHELGDNMQVPLKLGHNKEQKVTDGAPALGWARNIVFESGKLLADFIDVPDVMVDSIKKNLFKNVSIELDAGVQWKEKFFNYVLSGVAILGADIPAVNVLADLKTFLTREQLCFKSKQLLTFNYQRGDDMDELEKARKELAELKQSNATLEAEKVTFTAEKDKLEAEAKTVKFTADKKDIETSLDDLVKSEVIVPATREKFMAKINDADTDSRDSAIESVKFSIDTLKETMDVKSTQGKEQGKSGNANEEEESDELPSVILCARAKKVALEHKVSFSVARKQVIDSDPVLGRAYMDEVDGGDK